MQNLDKIWKDYLIKNEGQFHIMVDIESIFQIDSKIFYYDALDCLQYLSQRENFYLILYVYKQLDDLESYIEIFKKYDIIFKDIVIFNINNYDKTYFDYLINDKIYWSDIFKIFYNGNYNSVTHHVFENELITAHRLYENSIIPKELYWLLWYNSLKLKNSWCSDYFKIWRKVINLQREDRIIILDTYDNLKYHYEEDLKLEWTFSKNQYGYLDTTIKRFLFFKLDNDQKETDIFKLNLKMYHYEIINEDYYGNSIICILGLKI